MTLYAKWNPIAYAIHYELNGGENAAANPAFYYFGSTIQLGAPKKGDTVFEGCSYNII